MNKVNYYAVIPAKVRHDNELTPLARILFAEIVAQSTNRECCTITNKELAKLYRVRPETISRAISQLVRKNYVIVKRIATEESETIVRKTCINHKCFEGDDSNE